MQDSSPGGFPIDVLILTYNGAPYIAQQLSSIADQLDSTDRIVVSDDGSDDGTLEIIQRHPANDHIEIHIIHGPGQGVIRNFFTGLSHTRAEYVLIADQDDVWRPGKRQQFAQQMKHSARPHLIFSDALIWDGNEDSPVTSFWAQQQINPEHARRLSSLLFRNCVQGASMAINRTLIEQLADHPDIVMHDWWSALHACAFGEISIIREPTLLYRQHSGNQVGALQRRTFQQNRKASQKIFAQASAFRTMLPLEHPDYSLVNSFHASRSKGWAAKLNFLFKYRPIRANFLKSVTLWASILFISKT